MGASPPLKHLPTYKAVVPQTGEIKNIVGADKIPQEKGIKITDAIKDLKESLTQGTEQIKPKLDALKAIVNEVTTELYKNTAPPNGEQESSQEKESTGDQNTGEEKTDSENNQEQKTDQDSEQKSENS